MNEIEREAKELTFEAMLKDAGFEGDVRIVNYDPERGTIEVTGGVFTEYELRALSNALMMTNVVTGILQNASLAILENER